MARLLMVALAALLLGCGGTGGRQGYPLSSEIASAIPGDTVMLGGGRLDLLQQSPAFAKLQPMLPQGGLDQATSRLGLDPRKDVRELVVAFNGRDAVIIVRGAFQPEEVFTKLATQTGFQRSEYKGKAVMTQAAFGAIALSSGMIAAGPIARLHECADRLAASSKLDERWAAGLRAMPAKTHLWFLSAGGATLNLPRGSNIGNIDKILGSIDGLSSWADLSSGLHLTAKATGRDAEAAKQLHTQLRGLIGLGRLSTPDSKPELLKLYDGIQTKLEDRTIDIEVDVPMATLDVLLKQ
jgi:hypothetical protein